MKNDSKTIARLIKQIQRGNQSAFEEFYKLTSPKAYFIALKITQNEHDAEDVLQESYIKALEKINEIDTSQNVTSWFLKIVSNKSKDLLKSKNHLVFDSEEEGYFDDIPEEKTEFCPEENLDQEELRLEVMAAIDELTAEKRACIMMMYFGDMSVKEIAESIEVPESTVKNRLHTARKDLRSRFEKNGNVLYGAAIGGVLVWALDKTSVTASAAFLASAASAEIVAGATTAYTAGAATAGAATSATAASATAATTAATATTAASTAASTAAATGAGVAAKVAALSVAQKVVIGAVAASVVGGSTAGVATVVKEHTPPPTTTQYIVEEVTTAPSFETEYAFAVSETETQAPTTSEETTEKTTKREPAATVTHRETTAKKTTQRAETTAKKEKEKTTRRPKKTTTQPSTTQPSTAHETTTAPTTTKETTTEPTTAEETTSKPTTTRVTTTKAPTTTSKPETTTEPTTQSPATLIIEVTDFDNSVVATITESVPAGTQLTNDYLVSLVSANGYEAMAGVYGDAIGSAAEGGQTYNFTAEL